MGSSSRSYKPSHAIIVDERPYRSTSTSSHGTMSSQGSYSSLSNSDSYGHSSSSTYRHPKSDNYTVETSTRGPVSVHNYGSSGFEPNAPHPTYGSNGSKKDEPKK